MAKIPFEKLDDDARLWVFGMSRGLEAAEQEELLATVDGFLDDWKAHGAPLRAARDLREGRFLLVGVDEASVPPSGCSIDAMVGVLSQLEGRLGVKLVDHGAVYFRDDAGAVRRVGRAEFRRLADGGEVDPGTTVFDTTLTRVGGLRDGLWERPARETWHQRAFFAGRPD